MDGYLNKMITNIFLPKLEVLCNSAIWLPLTLTLRLNELQNHLSANFLPFLLKMDSFAFDYYAS